MNTSTDLDPTATGRPSAAHRLCATGCGRSGTVRVSSREVTTARRWRAEEVRYVCTDCAARMRGEDVAVVRLEDLPPIVPHPLTGKPKPKREPRPSVPVSARPAAVDSRDRSGYPMCSTPDCPRRSHTMAGRMICASCSGKLKRERERAAGKRRSRPKREPRPCVDCGRVLLVAAWGRCVGCDSRWRRIGRPGGGR